MDLDVQGIEVEFCGEYYRAANGQLTIGGPGSDITLEGDLPLPILVVLERVDNLWWVTNRDVLGGVTVAQPGVRTSILVDSSAPLVAEKAEITFDHHLVRWGLEVRLAVVPERPATTSRAVERLVTLNSDQLQLLAVLAEPSIRYGQRTPLELPSNLDAAQRLGWTFTKFNRKLDHLCHRLEKAGLVRGTIGSFDRLASNRRAILVAFALNSELVTADNIDDLVPSRFR